MVAKGLTLPNRQWDDFTPAELAALEDLAPQTLVVLLYGSSIDATHAQQLAPYLQTHPQTRILLRMFDTTIGQRDPTAWAGECKRRLLVFLAALPLADTTVEVIPWNEPNVEWTDHLEDWSYQTVFAQTFLRAWRSLVPGVACHLPALSPTGNWEAALSAYAAAGLPATFDELDCHAYTDSGIFVVSSTYSLFGNRTLCITEFDQTDPGRFLSNVSGSANTACYFLLGGTPDQSQYDILQPANAGYYASFKGWTPMPSPTPAPTVPVSFLAGCDVSMFQNTIDWPNFGQCTGFVAAKATQGIGWTDPNFGNNWYQAGIAGLPRIAYDFGVPAHTSGHTESFYLRQVLTRYGFNPFDNTGLDLEDDPTNPLDPAADLAAFAIDWANDQIANLGIVKPWLYSNRSFLTAHKLCTPEVAAVFNLWLAEWGPVIPATVAPWPNWGIWQWSKVGSLPGIGPVIDLDYFAGTVDQLRAWGKKAA